MAGAVRVRPARTGHAVLVVGAAVAAGAGCRRLAAGRAPEGAPTAGRGGRTGAAGHSVAGGGAVRRALDGPLRGARAVSLRPFCPGAAAGACAGRTAPDRRPGPQAPGPGAAGPAAGVCGVPAGPESRKGGAPGNDRSAARHRRQRALRRGAAFGHAAGFAGAAGGPPGCARLPAVLAWHGVFERRDSLGDVTVRRGADAPPDRLGAGDPRADPGRCTRVVPLVSHRRHARDGALAQCPGRSEAGLAAIGRPAAVRGDRRRACERSALSQPGGPGRGAPDRCFGCVAGAGGGGRIGPADPLARQRPRRRRARLPVAGTRVCPGDRFCPLVPAGAGGRPPDGHGARPRHDRPGTAVHAAPQRPAGGRRAPLRGRDIGRGPCPPARRAQSPEPAGTGPCDGRAPAQRRSAGAGGGAAGDPRRTGSGARRFNGEARGGRGRARPQCAPGGGADQPPAAGRRLLVHGIHQRHHLRAAGGGNEHLPHRPDGGPAGGRGHPRGPVGRSGPGACASERPDRAWRPGALPRQTRRTGRERDRHVHHHARCRRHRAGLAPRAGRPLPAPPGAGGRSGLPHRRGPLPHLAVA